MQIIRHRSAKPYTLAVLETHKGKSGTPVASEEVIVLERKGLTVTVETNTSIRTLETNSPDASVYTVPHDPAYTYRLRQAEEAVA